LVSYYIVGFVLCGEWKEGGREGMEGGREGGKEGVKKEKKRHGVGR
jgi:hypothetical protein